MQLVDEGREDLRDPNFTLIFFTLTLTLNILPLQAGGLQPSSVALEQHAATLYPKLDSFTFNPEPSSFARGQPAVSFYPKLYPLTLNPKASLLHAGVTSNIGDRTSEFGHLSSNVGVRTSEF